MSEKQKTARGEEKEEKRQALLETLRAPERELRARGARYIAGVDEVGRGPLAGPVVAAAVVLPEDFAVLGVNDSKKLSEKQRERLNEEILTGSIAYGFGAADNTLIDRVNILEATKRAMSDALAETAAALARKTTSESEEKGAEIDHVLIDAVTLPGLAIPQSAVVKGDEKCLSIAAASIIAKVRRDRLMREYHRVWPAYAFDRNKGYGTRAHYAGIEAAGLCPLHRRTFCRNITEAARDDAPRGRGKQAIPAKGATPF